MTKGDCGPQEHTAESLVSQLAETVQRVDQDDLSGLAKMHGWCQALAEACSSGAVPEGENVGKQAKSLLGTLESLILGEAEDAARALATVVDTVAELAKSITSAPGETSPPAADQATADEPGEQESVEAKLAKVFDDPPPAEQTAEAQEEPPEAAALQDNAEAPAGSDTSQEPSYDQVPLVLKQEEIDFVKGFVEEAGEHIEAIEAAVLEVEASPEDTAKINDLFRPFHTIKGMAGFLNLRDINCLTHEVETLLDQGRKGDREVTPALIDVIFDVVDVLKVQIASVGEWAVNPQGEVVPQPPVAVMIDQLRGLVSGRINPIARQPGPGSPTQKVGENLVEQGAVPQEVADFALEQQQAAGQAKKLGETLVEMKAATPRQVSQAIRPQAQAKVATAAGQKSVGDQSIRIDTAKLDVLVDMVGELVIAQTLVNASRQVSTDPQLSKDVNQVSKIVREVQEVAMSMRMVPIGPTFQKMARLVRDVSRKAGKQVHLSISGEDTELDKTVIQQIGDPLVHMVRNAVDHGIEAPQERSAAGKPEIGNVHLGASHQGGNIVIEIRDDGKGLDPQKLIEKGIERGIVEPGEQLTDQQAYSLIFSAGFSMAKKVTDISGRGVGMDVVKRNIDQLRGKVDITSESGNGSTFSIRLPLTLAIIDGMVIRVGNERFIVPTIAIEQSLRPRPEQITTVQQRGEVLNIRGRLVPLVQLGRLFGLTGRTDPCEAMVVVAHCEGREIGLVVEELIGQQQVVIKTLGERFRRLRGISGAAILGDGRVGLILEMSGLAAAHQARMTAHTQHDESGRGAEADDGPTDHRVNPADHETCDATVQGEPECVSP